MDDDLALPLIDVSGLVAGEDDQVAAAKIDRACRQSGFFRVSGHGVDPELLANLDRLSRDFFARPEAEKRRIAMIEAGTAWRGWFPVGGELTAGVPDKKEGLYVGRGLAPDHPRVLAGTPLHGANLFPAEPAELGPTIEAWLDALIPLAHAVMRGIAIGLGLAPKWFERNVTQDPTVLFRVFHYPPGGDADWGVAEHTDYGLLTLLAQDDRGGLQVHADGGWIDVPADPSVFVCNIGDMLDRLTEGRYRSTPHRVRNLSGTDRLSFPLFFDPSWDAEVPSLPLEGSATAVGERPRWDGADVHAWEGAYGDYLTAKVARVFPELFAASTSPSE
ncbi:MAG: 2-oxoglutarate and iron-dependent oxygenase domain-containing protein [Acidimicrobiales bacterium]